MVREMPISGDFLNISSRVPSEEASPQAPSAEPLQRETLHPQLPLHPSLEVTGRCALLQAFDLTTILRERIIYRN